jgi:nucleoside-diphosphate-sugar epimerase
VYNEDDYFEPDGRVGYIDSKVYEEKLIRNFINEQDKESENDFKTEVVILNPAFIIGPTLLNTFFSSLGFIKPILFGEWEGIGNTKMAVVDVRDVAYAHY